MTYQNRKDSSVQVRLIIKTPFKTVILNNRETDITTNNQLEKIDVIAEYIKNDLEINIIDDNKKYDNLVSSEGSDKNE